MRTRVVALSAEPFVEGVVVELSDVPVAGDARDAWSVDVLGIVDSPVRLDVGDVDLDPIALLAFGDAASVLF